MSNAPPSAYVLCSNPRSGTTLLCDLLRQTGVAGTPDSFFRQKSFDAWCTEWGVPAPLDISNADACAHYVEKMRQAGGGQGGLFGMRVMGPDINTVRRVLTTLYGGASDLALIERAFGDNRYIHLSRQDKVAEAVSYLRAEQTGLWHSDPAGNDIERIQPTEPDGYDAARIAERVRMLTEYDAAWHAWFHREEVIPLSLTYEALAEDPLGTLHAVLDFLGLDPALSLTVAPGTRKLADNQSQAWIARFKADHS